MAHLKSVPPNLMVFPTPRKWLRLRRHDLLMTRRPGTRLNVPNIAGSFGLEKPATLRLRLSEVRDERSGAELVPCYAKPKPKRRVFSGQKGPLYSGYSDR